jgi:glycosyltransferase involved in cell wall biosynthesis
MHLGGLQKMIKKICHITTVHPPFDVRIFHKECKTLAKAGYEVYLIAQHDKDENVDGINIISLPKINSRMKRILILPIRAFFKAMKLKADVYHFHDPELLPVGVLLKIFTGRKVIYDVHENVPKQILNKSWIPLKSNKFISLIYSIIEKFSLFFIDFVIIAEDSYIENYSNIKKIEKIRNYPLLIYINNVNNNKDKFWAKKWNIIYVGGITKIRGIFEVIEAIRILNKEEHYNVLLKLIGPFYPIHLLNEVINFAREYEIMNNIEIYGEIPHDKVFNFLSNSQIGIAILHPDPNYIDSIPTKLFEYMIVGLPVIASNFPLWKEIVEGNNCGICVNPLDPKEIANAIKYLIDHPDEARAMGENGRRSVLEKYNWEKESEKLIRLYEEILK